MKHISEVRWSRLYRARDGMILGVCKGLARALDVPVVFVRLLAVMVLFFSGLWPAVGAYLLAGFLMKPEPVLCPDSDAEREFYDDYVASREKALARVKRRFERLSARIARLEEVVTSREYDFDRRLKG